MNKEKTNIEETFAIIKSDAFYNATQIVEILMENGLEIVKLDIRQLDTNIIKEHYSHILDRPFYPELEAYMTAAPVVLMILRGENAISKLRTLMGPTDVTKAPKGTIRNLYGTTMTYNGIHGSDAPETAKAEIARFFPEYAAEKTLLEEEINYYYNDYVDNEILVRTRKLESK